MDCNTTSGVLKSNRRPVQATGQHDGEKLQVFVLLQHEASLEYLKNPFQSGERVVRVANDVGRSSRNSEVHELVVPRGQVYFESESLSKFMSNREVNRSSHQASECQNDRVKLIHCRVENEFASAAELGSYVNKFFRSTS